MERRHAPTPERRCSADGYTFVEVVVALTLGGIVVSLVGSLLIASLGAWRRGQDLRMAQAYATIVVDTITRDVRRASRTTGVSLHPPLAVEDGEPILAILEVAGGPEPSGASILYVYRPDRRAVVRQILVRGPDGRLETVAERLVSADVAALAVRPSGGDGVLVEAEVRRGRATARAQGTSAPRNP